MLFHSVFNLNIKISIFFDHIPISICTMIGLALHRRLLGNSWMPGHLVCCVHIEVHIYWTSRHYLYTYKFIYECSIYECCVQSYSSQACGLTLAWIYATSLYGLWLLTILLILGVNWAWMDFIGYLTLMCTHVYITSFSASHANTDLFAGCCLM